MITSVNLFNLLPTVNGEEYKLFEKSVIDRYSDYFSRFKSYYCGQFIPLRTDRFNMCGVYQWDFRTIEEAKESFKKSYVKPRDMNSIEKERRSFHDNKGEKMNLWIESLVPSPNSNLKINISEGILRFISYGLAPGKGINDFIEFDRRVTNTYTAHMKQIDWYYMGTFKIDKLGQRIFGELDYVKAPSPEAAMERDKGLGESPEITEIISECSTFPHPDNKFGFWLKPFLVSEYAQNGIKFN